jgi:excisionase family DNA binding protein
VSRATVLEHTDTLGGNVAQKKWYSRAEAAEYLGVSGHTIDRYRRFKKLPAKALNGESYRYKGTDLDRLLKDTEAKQPEEDVRFRAGSPRTGTGRIATDYIEKIVVHGATNEILQKLTRNKPPTQKPTGEAGKPEIDLMSRKPAFSNLDQINADLARMEAGEAPPSRLEHWRGKIPPTD